jgi:DNA polymerase-3 subunit beta
MKFSVSSSELLKQLQVAGGAISNNPVLPILEDFLFRIENNVLTIVATDMESTIVKKMDVTSDANGSIAIPAKILLETLKALPQQPITFSVNPETKGVEITSAYGKYKLSGEDGDDFPDITHPDFGDDIRFSSEILLDGINKTLFATSQDELRLAMNGVFFKVETNSLTLVATDAHKLVKCTFSNVESKQRASFIIPKKSLNLLKAALSADEPVAMMVNETNAFFSFNNTTLICRLIDARYPDYNAVIPLNNPNLLVVSRQDFLSSLKRIYIYASKTSNNATLSLNEGSLTLTSKDLDFSNEATEQMPCEYTGDPMDIAFNGKFLIEMLSVLDCQDVQLKLASSGKAGILVPGDLDENEDIIMLLMPVLLDD